MFMPVFKLVLLLMSKIYFFFPLILREHTSPRRIANFLWSVNCRDLHFPSSLQISGVSLYLWLLLNCSGSGESNLLGERH